MSDQLPLNIREVKKPQLIINRLHIFFHGIALLALFYYRITTLFQIIESGETPLFPYLLVFFAEIILSIQWILTRPYRWWPIRRAVFPERLPPEEKFPPIDVFVCTADPSREPAIGVMNTVISAMALDYPPEKLAVYLSDDGGAPVTLAAMRESWKFAKVWLPFCRKYKVKPRCPDAYLSGPQSDEPISSEFAAEKNAIQEKYEEFKKSLEKNIEIIGNSVSKDHPPVVEVINEADDDQKGLPLLVYVAREKRPSRPHHFKAGGLNALLRVSALLTNAPYFVIMDCDHYCNDPTSARQALCFFFDPEISKELAFVQFPQNFYNSSKYDIYDGKLRHHARPWDGIDGLRGPMIAGCNLFLKREAIYGLDQIPKDADLNQLKKIFGSNIELINSTSKIYESNKAWAGGKLSDALKKELHVMASCSVEDNSGWGSKVGSMYDCVVEDALTSLTLHSRGWKTVWVDPQTPCFLGTSPTNLNDTLVQQSRWAYGCLQMALSKYSPVIYGPYKVSILQTMSYIAMTVEAFYTIPFYILAVVPQIGLLHGTSLYPSVSSPFFYVFAFLFISSQLKYLQEVLSSGDSLTTALYELRMWMMKCTSSFFYAVVNGIRDVFGLNEANFFLTSKVVDDEQVKRHQEGIYDFQGSPQLLAPLCSLYILNLIAFFIGTARMFQLGKASDLVAQAVLPLFGILVNLHLFEGMLLRTDEARVPSFITGISVVSVGIVLALGLFVLF